MAYDDGTLTAVFEDIDMARRIFTATTQFVPRQPIIKPGLELNEDIGGYIETHCWQKDPQAGDDPNEGARARRVHKLRIFRWPMIGGPEDALKLEETEALPPGSRTRALPEVLVVDGLPAPRIHPEETRW